MKYAIVLLLFIEQYFQVAFVIILHLCTNNW